MRKLVDLTGKKFGKVTVIKRVEDYRSDNGSFATCWLCKCDCGNTFITKGSNLKSGVTKSCGCLNKPDLSGKRFGNLLVIKEVIADKRRSHWLCKCDCGNETVVRADCLTRGITKSCGKCLNHNKSKTKIYKVWAGIKQRCFNKEAIGYNLYGGRGINVCKEWIDDFMSFYNWAIANGYKDGLSIDRIDVNGDYCPENCRWVTQKEQNRNKRNNHLITFNGETHCMAEWGQLLGFEVYVLRNRINLYHWNIDKALKTAPKKCKRRN